MGSSYRKKKGHEMDNKGKGILYEDDDAPIKLTDQDDTLVDEEFKLSLIGKILNPKKQDIEKLLQKMPSQWGMEERVTANDLGNGKFLINFTTEEDLNYVLRQGPFHFNFRMFVLVRWEPIVHDDYPWLISFWVTVIGLPLHLWTETNLKNIGARIGHVHDDSLQVIEGRMLIDVDSRRPLKFSRKVESKDGDEVTIEIKYQKLFKHCSTCGMLSHEKEQCPTSDVRTRLQPQTEKPDVFTRMQLPLEQPQRQSFQRGQRVYQPPNQQIQTTREHSQQTDYTRRSGSGGYDSRISHTDRTIRRRNEFSRSNKYGSSRTHNGPYDRHPALTWREKTRTNEMTIASSKSSDHKGKESTDDRHQIVPYEQSTPLRIKEVSLPADQEAKSERKSTTKRLASTIVTPSRDEKIMEENVTKRAKGPTRSLSFDSLTDKEQGNIADDNQIIGALNDMEMEDQQEEGMQDEEMDDDEDLLKLDLIEMDAKAFERGKTTESHREAATSKQRFEGKHSRSGRHSHKGRNTLQNKKFEVLRRGSPRRHLPVTHGAHTARELTKSKRHDQSSKTHRHVSDKSDGVMGSKNSSHVCQ